MPARSSLVVRFEKDEAAAVGRLAERQRSRPGHAESFSAEHQTALPRPGGDLVPAA
jgi:hypothetical protein